MPRTSFSRGPGEEHWSDQELRHEAERCHYGRQWSDFWSVFKVRRPPGNAAIDDGDHDEQAKRRPIKPPLFLGNITLNVDQLPPAVVRKFCFKDCMVYNIAASHHLWRTDLYWRIYRRWYPSRAQDTDISHESFFCQLASFRTVGEPTLSQSVGQITAFHKLFCHELERQVADLTDQPEPEGLGGWPADTSLLYPMAPYKLRPTFSKCFLIMHDEEFSDFDPPRHARQDRGATIVWLRVEDVVIEDDHHDMKRLLGDGIPEQIRAFRCETLESALQSVLLTTGDPERSSRKQEWHGHFKEALDQNKTDFDPTCHCFSCPGLVD